MRRPREEISDDDCLARHLAANTPPAAFCLDVADRSLDVGDVLGVLLALAGEPQGRRALGRPFRAALADPVRFAADVAAAGALGHADAHEAAVWLAAIARWPAASPLGPLDRPRESPALLCASVARGTFELLARVAALDAVAERHAAVALHEDALVGYMD